VADEGQVLIAGSNGSMAPLQAGSPMAALTAGVGMVHQHFTLADNLTGLENIMLGTESIWAPMQDVTAARHGLTTLMRDSGLIVDLDRPVHGLSVGERQRVEILKALYRGCRVLVLDEPTAVLTPQEAEQLFNTLRHLAKQGVGLIFISHKLMEVRALADRVCILRNGRMVAECDARRTSDEELAEAMVGRLVEQRSKESIPPGAALVKLKGVSVSGRHDGLRDVDLVIRSHEIVGIAGVSGNGQAVLASLLAGKAVPDSGTFSLLGTTVTRADPGRMIKAGVGRIPEDRHKEGIVGDMAVWENLLLESCRSDPRWNRGGVIMAEDARRYAADMVQRYRVRCPSVQAKSANMSGGNIQKLILARIFEQAPRIILANQPTRGLDIGAVVYVHERLLDARARGAGILLISEDLDEVLTLADRVHVMFQGRLSPALGREMLEPSTIGLMMAGKSHAA
jgi:simple sugar transport system ATP-binding protein